MADISAYLNPFQALAQGAAQGYQQQSAVNAQQAAAAAKLAAATAYQQGQLDARNEANNIRSQSALGYTDAQGNFHPGTVQNGADRVSNQGRQITDTNDYHRMLVRDTIAQRFGNGTVPGQAYGAADSVMGGQPIGTQYTPDSLIGAAPAASIANKNASTNLITQGRLPLILAQTDRETQMTPSVVSASNTKAQYLPQQDAAGIKQKQAAAMQAIMNTNTLPALRTAQEGALSTNAGANAYRANIYGQVAPIQAATGQENADTNRMNAGTNVGKLNLDTQKYNVPKLPSTKDAIGIVDTQLANISKPGATVYSSANPLGAPGPAIKDTPQGQILFQHLINQRNLLLRQQNATPYQVSGVRPIAPGESKALPQLPPFNPPLTKPTPGMTNYRNRAGKITASGPAPGSPAIKVRTTTKPGKLDLSKFMP